MYLNAYYKRLLNKFKEASSQANIIGHRSYTIFRQSDFVRKKMNCPECGSSITSGQQFCRVCGVGLFPDATELRGERAMSRSQKIRLAGFISIFVGLAIALTGSMLFHVQLIVYVGVLMNFLGMFLTVYPSIVPQSRRSIEVVPQAPPESLRTPQTTKKLMPMDDTFIIPSVTEGTTDLLKTDRSTTAKAESNLP